MLPTLNPLRVGTHHRLNCVGERSRCVTAANTPGRQKYQAGMASPIGQSFRRDRPEILDVVAHDRTLLVLGGIHDLPVGGLEQIGTLHHRLDIQTALS